ncbi:MAG: 50S ribosomal protein L29 [Candidatus Pacebacteria bacterium CG10_big_fil_rev_8_21_14_0_10_36_11]|nr:50S ribosomal protein L29 [Candidatus Pacearchaeota archaeon]OIP73695.1 MAG: 50S ribosomal protein L29 [Candidatus Pacebacteria bacterium CG2_30_36_39]PIR64720.1 MAG: 50S ribosomal protein L29 [Candidatus Pacebacteria bacterium CG10_big_fil_rev_8_21_14_0_10_36_11]PJC42343.1 MAG: 50S ribosomal protein L29 [Candidatus Pacebacteria bacterium CG_4_9_14_0_2_um_filter_36_8]
MKRKDITELRAKNQTELMKMQADLQMELAKIRMERVAGKLANTRLVATLSDDLARIKTVLGQLAIATEQKETK